MDSEMADTIMDDGFMEQLDYMEFNFDSSTPAMSRSLRPPSPAHNIGIYNLKADAAELRQRAIMLLQEIEQFEAQWRERYREVLVGNLKKEGATELKNFNRCLDAVTPDRKAINRVRITNR
jgi:hypothetical protein